MFQSLIELIYQSERSSKLLRCENHISFPSNSDPITCHHPGRRDPQRVNSLVPVKKKRTQNDSGAENK